MFKDNEIYFNLILRNLESVGITFHEEIKGYRFDIWKLKCKWKSEDEIKIIWHKNFTEDVTIDIDNFAEFVVNGNTLGSIKIYELRKKKLLKSFNETIANSFKEIAGEFTGKFK